MLRPSRLAFFLATITAVTNASAAEICGNGIDDDADLLVDEQCYPGLTTGQCESPLSCADTGDVSPSTGSLRYQLEPDIAPNVPYGPGIGFRRFYVSQYAPGGGAPAYRKPMGDRWGHTYMSWLDKNTTPSPDQVVVHLPRGQDAMFQFTSTVSGWDEYKTFQPGFHFVHLRQRVASPNEYELKLLTGEVLAYNSSGKLIEIRDTLQTPGKVTLTYDGNGMVSTVTAASGNRRLLFGYTSSQLTSIAFQIGGNGTSWVTYHTTTYGYTSSNLTTVTIGGQLAQTNVYTSNYLTSIQDGGGNSLVNFVYDGTTAGKIVRIDTPRGVVGYEFGSSRTECSGKTVLFFHRLNTSSCNVDSDCGTGYLCGGKTGSGSTGQCFRGARCLTVASPSEDVVTTVSSFAGNSETCDGACLDAAEYIWNTSSGALDLAAVKDPSNKYSVRTFNSNGLPTAISYGDSNSTFGSGTREMFLTYGDSNFPGLVTEVRRKGEIGTTTGCTSTPSSPCQRTIFSYTDPSTSVPIGKLTRRTESGNTYNTSGTSTSFSQITDYTYDNKGRLTQIDGPLTGANDVTQFEYWSSSTLTKDGFLQNLKRKKDATTFLTQSSLDFDFWGNPTSINDADGTISCQTFDSARGHLTQRREQMAGQTNCTPNAADIVTSYTRDSALRLTQLTRPDGSCVIYEYDTRGRLSKTKRRDDCNGASSGDREEYTYSNDGLVTKIETFDSAGTVTRRKEMTYLDSRRLEKLINPVNTAKWTGFGYEARGLISSVAAVDGSSDLSRTEWTYDDEGRTTSEKRYKAASSFDTWNLLFDWIGGQKQVTDGDSKVTTSTRDDIGRVVQLSSPDLGGFPTLRVHDSANRLVTMKETFGGAGVKTHSFTFDNLGRPLEADYNDTCFNHQFGGTSNVPDIVRIYDTLPGGLTCPFGSGACNRNGRLIYVKVKLACEPDKGLGNPDGHDNDWTLEQETFYQYDDAGRPTREYIQDETGRVADQSYSWTKNGALAQTTLPSSTVIGATFGSAGSNSDTDRVTTTWRTSTSTPIVSDVVYEPYGPLYRYHHQHLCSAAPGLRTTIEHNLAYRVTETLVDKQNGTGTRHKVAISEDAKGRPTLRNYYPSDPQITGLFDSYFKYDQQDRVLCETTSSGASCPSSGSSIKNSHTSSPPFTAAGDWKQLKRPIPGANGLNHDITLVTNTHQILKVDQNDGTTPLGVTDMTYDSRGNRDLDDNKGGLSHDARTYSYDDRRNVTNVRGEYYTGGAWHYYDVSSIFDAKNRRVYKSFFDETTLKTSTWFFYYDAVDRLTEIRYTPDSTVPATYQLWQLLWLGDRLTAYWQTDYPSATTSKRYVGTDEAGRPVDMINWPNSGNCSRVWSINPDAWGNDTVLIGAAVFQPILFAGQYKDEETIAWMNDGSTRHRPNLVLNGYRTYDPWIGLYLQVDPIVDQTWSSYLYVYSDPVGRKDRVGLAATDVRTQGPEYIVLRGSAPDPQGTACWEGGFCFPGGGANPSPLPPQTPRPGGGGGGDPEYDPCEEWGDCDLPPENTNELIEISCEPLPWYGETCKYSRAEDQWAKKKCKECKRDCVGEGFTEWCTDGNDPNEYLGGYKCVSLPINRNSEGFRACVDQCNKWCDPELLY